MAVEWTHLAELWESKPVLYSPTLSVYLDWVDRRNAIEEIAEVLNLLLFYTRGLLLKSKMIWR